MEEDSGNSKRPGLKLPPSRPIYADTPITVAIIVISTVLVKPIGEDQVEDTRILRFHVTSSLSKNPVLQLLFDVSKEPAGLGNCVLTTILARLGAHSILFFFHIPVGGCKDPSICNVAMGRFGVARLRRR